MIIVQTPMRISFFGGGTDFPDYFHQYGGCVLSTTIDKYIFVTIKQRFDDFLRVGWTKTEIVETLDELQHELIRESFRLTGLNKGIEITTMGDIPAGTGLGSSSTVTVGALHAMYAFLNQAVSPQILAEQACKIEIDTLQKPIGVQDQYIAAYGGLNLIEFNQNQTVSVEKIHLDPILKQRLNENLLLFYTGMKRQASDILEEQQNNIQDRLSILSRLKEMAYQAAEALKQGQIDYIGTTLHESWMLKKQLASKISNSTIDGIYEKARAAGALGGKVTGAGGGGFLLLYCPLEKREHVRKALSGYREIPIKLEETGSKVIFDYRR